MRILFWIFVLLVAAVFALFAISNRAGVALSLWPLPFLVEAPLYLIALGGALLGFLLGELAAWIAASRRRRELRRQRRHIAALEAELRGFGAFSVKRRDARVGRNPRTGDSVQVAEKHIPFFKTGKQLRDRLNHPPRAH